MKTIRLDFGQYIGLWSTWARNKRTYRRSQLYLYAYSIYYTPYVSTFYGQHQVYRITKYF